MKKRVFMLSPFAMKNLFYIGVLLSMPALTAARANFEDLRPEDLDSSSAYEVNLTNATLLSMRKQEWLQVSDQARIQCTLRINSHFDRELAQKATHEVYTLDQINAQSYVHFPSSGTRTVTIQDQFSLWLITKNKDLPLLCLSCSYETDFDSPDAKKLTVGMISQLIGQPSFFLGPVSKEIPHRTAFEMLSVSKTMTTLVPLNFKVVPSGANSWIEYSPNFQNGRITKTLGPGAYCNIRHQSPSLTIRPYEITLPPPQHLKLNYVTSWSGSYSFNFKSQESDLELILTCYPGNTRIENFSEIEEQANSILEFNP